MVSKDKDRDPLWDAFDKRYKEIYSNEDSFVSEISIKVKKMWGMISPHTGKKVLSKISVNEKGEMLGTTLDWILLGAICSVIEEKINKDIGKKLNEIKEKVDMGKIERIYRDIEFLKGEIVTLKSMIRDLKK